MVILLVISVFSLSSTINESGFFYRWSVSVITDIWTPIIKICLFILDWPIRRSERKRFYLHPVFGWNFVFFWTRDFFRQQEPALLPSAFAVCLRAFLWLIRCTQCKLDFGVLQVLFSSYHTYTFVTKLAESWRIDRTAGLPKEWEVFCWENRQKTSYSSGKPAVLSFNHVKTRHIALFPQSYLFYE